MNVLLKLIDILPSFDFVKTMLGPNSIELMIANRFHEIVDQFGMAGKTDDKLLEETFIMVDAIKNHLWEIINTGHFSEVNKIHRQTFTLVSLQKTVLLLMKGHSKWIHWDEAREKCLWELDNGLLLGCPLDHAIYRNVLNDCLTIIQNDKQNIDDNMETTTTICGINNNSRPLNEVCEIEIVDRPSIEHFKENYFNRRQPVVLMNCMIQWPALSKWNKSSYLLEICRSRVVPIEIGKNYTNENWSQDLVKFEEFFRRQFLQDETSITGSKRIEYLAQHNLFDQIPTLRNDVIIPEYCCITNRMGDSEIDIDIDIKAWLGPEGTTSPMHIDEKHNLLCQVFGSKRIILAAPKDSINLYPFEGDMLKNTSQIDAENIDFHRFPLVKNVKFYSITLYKGEMLYIPPKWWHFVRSLSKSFSVSFWWE